MVSIVRSILIAIITTCGQAALFEWSASSSSAASSWYYTGRFCFRPQVNANPSTSILNVTIPYALRQIPLFLAVYWDDHTSQSECDERLECYESPYANDKWSNIYNGAPSDSTVAPSCNWRLNVAKLRGNLIDLRPYYGSGVGHSLNSSVKEIRYFGTRVREYHFALGACIPYANGGLERCSNRKASKNQERDLHTLCECCNVVCCGITSFLTSHFAFLISHVFFLISYDVSGPFSFNALWIQHRVNGLCRNLQCT